MIDLFTTSFSHLFINFLVALGVGLSIGIERMVNIRDARKMAGMRDFILIAILSFVSSLFYAQTPIVWLVSFGSLILFTLCIFVIRNMRSNKGTIGLTTALALPITFLLAGLPNFGAPFWIVATLLFGMLMVLGLKVGIHQFAKSIERHEIIDFALLIGIAVSITPLIPPEARLPIPLIDINGGHYSITYYPIMLATLWKVVVMVSLMNFIAHFVTKYLTGRSALAVATFLGGLVSSLATMLMLLNNNKKFEPGHKNRLSRDDIFLGYVSANAGAVFRAIAILRLAVGPEMFSQFAFPMISVFVMFLSLSLYSFYAHDEPGEARRAPLRITQRALPLKFIFKFSAVLAVLLIFMAMVTHYAGDQAFIVASFMSGMLSSAAAVTSIGATMMQSGAGFDHFMAGLAIIGALLGSTFAKYFSIVRHTGLKESRPFLLPILGLGLLGFATLWISFGGF